MKTIAVFLCLVPYVYIQATSPVQTPQQVQANALKQCILEKKPEGNKIIEIFNKDILPEDDPSFIDFFACYWEKANIINSDGSFNHFQIKIMYPYLIRERYENISEDEATKLSVDAVNYCQNVPKGNTVGIKGIRYRNCLTKFVLSKVPPQSE